MKEEEKTADEKLFFNDTELAMAALLFSGMIFFTLGEEEKDRIKKNLENWKKGMDSKESDPNDHVDNDRVYEAIKKFFV